MLAASRSIDHLRPASTSVPLYYYFPALIMFSLSKSGLDLVGCPPENTMPDNDGSVISETIPTVFADETKVSHSPHGGAAVLTGISGLRDSSTKFLTPCPAMKINKPLNRILGFYFQKSSNVL